MNYRNSYVVHPYIQHQAYASPYYDPVKAHEYYMRTRELKGRSSGQLNEKGQATKEYITKQINSERDAKLNSEDVSRESKLEAVKSQKDSAMKAAQKERTEAYKTAQENRDKEIESHVTKMNNEIESLRNLLENLPDGEKVERQAEISEKINKLREDNDNKRAELEKAYSSQSEKISADYTSKTDLAKNTYTTDTNSVRATSKQNKTDIREDAKNKIAEEVNKLYGDSSMVKAATSTKTKTDESAARAAFIKKNLEDRAAANKKKK